MIYHRIMPFFYRKSIFFILNAPVRPVGTFFVHFDSKNGLLDPKNPY